MMLTQNLVLAALFFYRAAHATSNSTWVSSTLGAERYINKGLVAFGFIPANFTEPGGDTIGGIGSAITLRQGSFSQSGSGAFIGTLIVQPDRGYNINGTIDYQSRQHAIEFVLNPYYGSGNLSFADAQQTLQLKYNTTLLYYERNETRTSGLDALAVRAAHIAENYADPPMPIALKTYDHLTLDPEGIAQGSNDTFWTSDEYGPYIYQFTSDGQLIQVIQPPQAFLPFHNGTLNFTAEEDPSTGRSANQGFEGLTTSFDGTKLYAILQSATMQDGGSDKSTNRYTRLLSYDISQTRPVLDGEWVVPLPQTKKGKTLPTSELHFVKDHVFLVLSRDGDGAGGSSNKSSYKQIDLIDISNATDIHDTKYDKSLHAVAKDGVLTESVKPATYVSFVSLVDSVQLARFGLHNSDPFDETLIASKWESIALASVKEPAYPDDYFLFTAADNDFQTTYGRAAGVPYDAGLNVDNQVLVFRVTLPGAKVLC